MGAVGAHLARARGGGSSDPPRDDKNSLANPRYSVYTKPER